MKNRSIILTLFLMLGLSSLIICSNVAIENPDYTETIPAGSKLYFDIDLDIGQILIIEFEVIAGGNKDVDLYIEDSDGYTVEDYGRVISGTIYFTVPYDDTFRIYFSNSFSVFTSKTVEISFDITYTKSITIYSPRSTDTFENGCNNEIRWSTTGSILSVRIELYIGSSFLEVISEMTNNDGSFSWCLFSSDTYDGSNYRIKISDYYDSSIYTFSESFSINISPESTQGFYIEPIIWVLIIIISSIIFAIIGAVIFLLIRRKRRVSEEIVPLEVQRREEPTKEEIPKIIYCSSCGSEILDKSGDFCSKCGAPIK